MTDDAEAHPGRPAAARSVRVARFDGLADGRPCLRQPLADQRAAMRPKPGLNRLIELRAIQLGEGGPPGVGRLGVVEQRIERQDEHQAGAEAARVRMGQHR